MSHLLLEPWAPLAVALAVWIDSPPAAAMMERMATVRTRPDVDACSRIAVARP